jgi:hypothetical protein
MIRGTLGRLNAPEHHGCWLGFVRDGELDGELGKKFVGETGIRISAL